MDRMQAKEKINKLLRLANDKGATASEKETALEMANKIAAKFGFKIQKGNPAPTAPVYNRPEVYTYQFDLGCFNKKLVDKLLSYLGIFDWELIGKKTVRFVSTRKFDVDMFKKYYKKFHPVYNGTRKNYDRCTANEYFNGFFRDFERGYNGDVGHLNIYSAFSLGKIFRVVKFYE